MDYKELIKLSRKAAEAWESTDAYHQAATLITALCEATETLLAEREAAGWISVEDRLPKSIANKVLVCCKNGYVGFGHYEDYKGVQTWFNLESGKPFSKWAHDDPDDYDITHWMPLPTPPDRQRTES